MDPFSKNPHDALFKAVFSQPEHAAEALRTSLPQSLLAWLDLSSLRLAPASFVDRQMSEAHADLLFEVRLCSGEEAFLYLLFEHQSTPDPWMPLRLLRYVVRVWDRWLADHPDKRRIPAVLPLVLYHGEKRWSAPLELSGLVDVPTEARGDVGRVGAELRYLLRDLGDVPDEALTGHALAGLVQLLLKYSREEDLVERFPRWAETWRRVVEVGGLRAVEVVVRYIFTTGARSRPEAILRFLGEELGEQAGEIVMTIAEQLREEGMRKGIEKGRQEGIEKGIEKGQTMGKRAMVQRLLSRRFGPVPAWATARIVEAGSEQLDAWALAVLDAQSVEALFAEAQ